MKSLRRSIYTKMKMVNCLDEFEEKDHSQKYPVSKTRLQAKTSRY